MGLNTGTRQHQKAGSQHQKAGSNEPPKIDKADIRGNHDGASPQKEDQPSSHPSVRERLPRTMRRSRQDNVLSVLTETVKETTYDAMQGRNFRVELVPVDASVYEMYYSCAAIAAMGVVAGETVQIIYTMVLEGSNTKPSREVIRMGDRHAEIVRTAMDAFDPATYNHVREAVTKVMGVPTDIPINAGGMVLPDHVDPSDKARIWEVVYGAMEAIWTAFETAWPEHNDHFEINKFIDQRVQKTIAHFHFQDQDGQVEDVAGNKLRSDFRMELAISDRDERDRRNMVSSFQHSGSRVVSELSGYIDLSFNFQQQQQMGMQQMGMQQPNWLFTPQKIYTGFTGRDYPMTPEFLFLSIAVNMLMDENYAWAHCFRNFDREEIHDPGAIGFRVPSIESKINTKEQDFGMDQLFSMMRMYVAPNVTHTIRCEALGANSWITDMILTSAEGVQNSTNQVIEALDRLTSNNFSPIWRQSTEPMFVPYTSVHLGHYRTSEGLTRDLSDIDRLAVLNLSTAADLSTANHWEMTYNAGGGLPIELQMDTRLKMIEEITRHTAEIRGLAVDVIMTRSFVHALFESVRACNLLVDQDGLFSTYGASAMPMSNVLSMHASSGINTNSMLSMGNGMGNGVQRNVASRWT